MLAYVKLFPDLLETVSAMDDAMAGRLIKAIMQYANGIMPKLNGPEKFVFLMLKSQIDRDTESYEKTRLANSLNGAKGGRPRKAIALTENQSVFAESEKSEKSQEEEKEEEKEEDKEKEYTTTSGNNTGGANPEPEPIPYDSPNLYSKGPDRLVIYATNNLTTLSPTALDELLSYRDTFPDEMIQAAIDETLAHGSRAYAYTHSILERWQKAGYRNMAEVKAADDKRKAAIKPDIRPTKQMITRDLNGVESDNTFEIMNRTRRNA